MRNVIAIFRYEEARGRMSCMIGELETGSSFPSTANSGGGRRLDVLPTMLHIFLIRN